MPPWPHLATSRVLLRPFRPADAVRVELLAGAYAVADTTLTIPHPYPAGAGAAWIATHPAAWARGTALTLAIGAADRTDTLFGAITLQLPDEAAPAELGYWIGEPFWGRGYATEAARALVAYAFGVLRLPRVTGRTFVRNPASGRVLLKSGLTWHGVQPAAVVRWGRPEDVAHYAALATDWPGGPVVG